MRNASKILAGLGIIAAIAGIGILIGWLGSHGSTQPVPPPPPPDQTMVDSSPGGHPATTATNPPAAVTANSSSNAALPNPNAVSSSDTNLLADWESRVDEILTEDTADTNKVNHLFEIFPHLPEEGQVEVAQHLSNLVPDENYAPLAQLLENAKLPEAVLDVLMADALNRPNAVKLPVILEVAQNPDHAKAGEAKDLLALYLDGDYGTDWSQWKQKLQEWLKENPD
jgi:hypothetical protein